MNQISLMVHPDKCKHPQAQEAFGALAKAQQLLLNDQERYYILTQVRAAKEELKLKRKKQLKKDTASKLKSLVDELEVVWETDPLVKCETVDKTRNLLSSSSRLVRPEVWLRKHGRSNRLGSAIVDRRSNGTDLSMGMRREFKRREIVAYDDIL